MKLHLVEGDQSRPIESLAALAEPVQAVAHRIVHGGELREPMLIDEALQARLEQLVELAPLHNSPAVDAIATARRALPDVPHVAVFDTAFHATMPPEAST